jgi:hypothetical protein
LLLITTAGLAFKTPDLQAVMIACMLLPLWESRKPMFVYMMS